MEKPFGSIRMDADKKKSKKKKFKEKSYSACRILPFSVARLGADGIRALPLITILPQRDSDLTVILGKRRKVLAETIAFINENRFD